MNYVEYLDKIKGSVPHVDWSFPGGFSYERLIGCKIVDIGIKPFLTPQLLEITLEDLEGQPDYRPKNLINEFELRPCITVENDKGEKLDLYLQMDSEGNGPGFGTIDDSINLEEAFNKMLEVIRRNHDENS